MVQKVGTPSKDIYCRGEQHNRFGTLYPHFPQIWICGVCYGFKRWTIYNHSRLCTNCLDRFSVPNPETKQCPNCTRDVFNTWMHQRKLYQESMKSP